MKKVQIGMTDEVLDICLDPVFKGVFTSENPESKGALKDFLSDFLEQAVSEVMIVANEPAVEGMLDKQIRFDISCKLTTGQLINVEMTSYPSKCEKVRIEVYALRLFLSQLMRGCDWSELKHAYQISVIEDGKMFNDDEFFHKIELGDFEHGIPWGGMVHIIIVELSKLESILEKNPKDMTNREFWAVFLKYVKNTKERKIINEILGLKEGVAMAAQALLSISSDEEMKLRAISAEKRVYDFIRDLSAERIESKLEGKLEGMQEEKRANARNALRLGFDIKQISLITGLTEDEITILQ